MFQSIVKNFKIYRLLLRLNISVKFEHNSFLIYLIFCLLLILM